MRLESSHLYASLVWDIIELLGRPWRVVFHHILREGNTCTDLLAKHGAQQEEALIVIEHPLRGLSFLLLANALGISAVRS